MALILNIETATDICSVCVSRGAKILSLKESDQGYDHAAQITLMIEACLKEAGCKIDELAAVAVSRGPGSFTALRIGAATAKGICYSLGVPLIAIDTLQSLALATSLKEKKQALYCPMIDARRMEVYTAVFDAAGQPLTEAHSLIVQNDSFSQYLNEGQELVFSGNGAGKCRGALDSPAMHFSDVTCSAKHLVELAAQAFQEEAFSDIAYFSPFYLKPPNITNPKKIFNKG
jgi:tRNA threonylcarbamoyladenosine biosynthesis protein TsaB